MTKVLIFKVEVESLENKIWRKIEITDQRTVADLAYTILGTFQTLAYHLYEIRCKDNIYDSWVAIEDDHSLDTLINATKTKLQSLNLKENDKLIMDYDTGSTMTYTITYLGSRDFEKGNGMHYPYIIDGAGFGVIDDTTNYELKQIIEDIDKKGNSNYQRLNIYNRVYTYDYRVFDLDKNNLHLRRVFRKIKNGYEVGEDY